MIICGNIVYTEEGGNLRTIPGGAMVLERDGRLREILERKPDAAPDHETVNYGERLIMPAFSDLHLHAPQYPMLGMGMDLPLLDWLNVYAFPTEAKFSDPEFARNTYRDLAEALIANGTTRVSMFSSLHVEATWILMEELESAGVTGYVGKVNMDRNGSSELQETTEGSKRDTLRWLDGCSAFTKVHPTITPRFTPSCTDELMQWLGELVTKRGLPLQSHISENLAEMDLVRELHPDCRQYWQTYGKYGLWNDKTLMAHCVWSDESERTAMREAGVYAVHCADSNINICSGITPVRTFLNEGVRVALGSDIAGGAQLPMNQVITNSIRASKAHCLRENWQAEPLSVPEAFHLGTAAGANYFGSKGSFALGEPLHAIVVDDASFPLPVKRLTLTERFERAVYLMTSANISAVYSDGRKVK